MKWAQRTTHNAFLIFHNKSNGVSIQYFNIIWKQLCVKTRKNQEERNEKIKHRVMNSIFFNPSAPVPFPTPWHGDGKH